VITNGAVRDLAAVEDRGFQLFSGSVSVSHAYTHVIEVNGPVTIAGLRIAPGDLLHGDRHGIIRIPTDIAQGIPDAIAHITAREREILEHCRSENFSKTELRKILGQER
jgi:regulator of RNase E activity RraA